MTKVERPPIKRSREDRKVIEPRRNHNALLRKKLLKKAINTSRGIRNVPPLRKPRQALTDNAAAPAAVRKTRTASEAASGVQRGWRKLYVGDLFEDTTAGDLKKEFGKFGQIFDVWIARNPPGFAFVDYFESRDAARALRVMDGNSKLGTKIKVEFAKKIGPRTASALSATKKRIYTQGRLPVRGGRPRRFSGSRGGPRFTGERSFAPPRRGMSPPPRYAQSPQLRGRSPPMPRRRSPLHRYRRSPSPIMRRGNYPPPPPLPPLPPMFDPYDPRFREMALMGGWNRGRSPIMAPPPPPPPRYYRSPSPPPPRYRGRSPPIRRSPGRFSRDRNRGRPREVRDSYDSKHAAASLVYPPLSLPPPSLLEMGDSPPRRFRSPPRARSPFRRSPPRMQLHSRSPPPRALPRGHSPPPRDRMPSPPPRSRLRSPNKHRLPAHGSKSSPSRRYSPHRTRSPPPRVSRSQNFNTSGPPSPPPNNRSWSPQRRNSSPPPMRHRNMPSRSRSPVQMRSPIRPRSPPPEPLNRAWTPPGRNGGRTPPRGYTPPRVKSRSPDSRARRDMSNHSKQASPPPQSSSWGHSPPVSHNVVRSNRSPLPRSRTPPRGYTPPARSRTPTRYKVRSPTTQNRGHQGSRNYRR